MARPKALSGFPEFLPTGKLIEDNVLAILADTFQLHGFSPIETRALEPLAQLQRKGDIEKEVYVVKRIHAPADEPAEFGLHFDLTVPFARYVLENAGHLAFPFRRYQIQKAWRGERPQEGRYREFLQADIDIVGDQWLAAHHDAEIPLVALDAFERLHEQIGIPRVVIHLNNRKLAEGFYRGLGIDDPLSVLQQVDKLDKIGATAVAGLLVSESGLSIEQADACVALAQICTPDTGFVAQVRALGVTHPLLDEGLSELAEVVELANQSVAGRVLADLKIARGLDYYTGTVYETLLEGRKQLGSVGSGGRYDKLASDGKRSFPGVGFSFGVSRLLVPMIQRGELAASRSVPTVVLVAVDDEASRGKAVKVASALRARGICTEVAPKADKFGKQIRYADRRGIPYVWFGAGYDDSVKDLRSGEQLPANPEHWLPAAEDLRVQIGSKAIPTTD